MGLHHTSSSASFRHRLEGYVFPEIGENGGFFPPQRASDMQKSRNIGLPPVGLNSLDDLPIWRVQGEAVLVVYRYSRCDDGTIVRYFVSCRYIGADIVQDKFLRTDPTTDQDSSCAHFVRQTEARRLIAAW